MVQAPEPAVDRDFPEGGFPFPKYGRIPQELVEKAIVQMDNFGKILKNHGVIVDRPTPLDFSQEVATPDWTQASMFGCMPPRDPLLTVGNEILEATMSYRSRWFEYLCYRPILEIYYQEDPNFRHEAAPKPRLSGSTYKKEFRKIWKNLGQEEKHKIMESGDWILTEVEPCFDAPDVARFGKDLFVQKSMVTNESGIRWLRQHFPNHRIHRVVYQDELPSHIDATLVPLRPGLVMTNPIRVSLEPRQEELFKKNDWKIIVAPESVVKKKRPLQFNSLWLNMNVLVLKPNTVFVEASEYPVHELLYKNGIEVIPIPFYDVSIFGGLLHCATLDVYREGTLEDYFPNQIEGF